MIILKANLELKTVFQKIVNTIDKNVKWTENFVINNNSLILLGELRSILFDFDNQKANGTILDLPVEDLKVVQITENDLLENTLNMTLYAFGKWGEIKGLKVEKDFERLNALINSILSQIDINAGLTNDSFRFYDGGMQITYEEVIQKILEENFSDETENQPKEEEYEIGLWHKILWEAGNFSFEKSQLTQKEKMEFRLGNNFYVVSYMCPECGQKMYMAIYPVGDEFRIETPDGGVYLSRAYTCSKCNIYYTPKPGKLLLEGDVYFLNFEDDKTAYEDYLEIIGKQGERTANCNFNMYESQYKNKDIQEEPEQLENIIRDIEDLPQEEIVRIKDKIESGFFPDDTVKKYINVIEKALKVKKSKIKKIEKENFGPEKKETVHVVQQSEATKKILKEIINEDRDYFIKRLAKLSPEQMKDFKKIIISEPSLNQEEKNIYVNSIDKIIYKEKESKFTEKVLYCKDKSYVKIAEVIKEISNEECAESIKAPILKSLREISEKRGKKELEYIISKIPENFTKTQYKQLDAKIQEYKDIEIRPFKKYLDDKWDDVEKKKIEVFIKASNPRDRKSFLETYNKLKEQEFEERNKAPILEKIYSKIYEMDQITIKKIFPDKEDMRFSDGIKAYEEISFGDYLPEIKSNTLELIDKRLTKMKMDECEQLVNKLRKELKWIDESDSGVYFYNTKKMMRKQGDKEYNIITNALNRYVLSRGKYEYPLLICDSTSSGKGIRGFVLTPDHIFYNGLISSGKIKIDFINEIYIGKGAQNKNIYVNLKNDNRIKLKNRLSQKEKQNFAIALDEFVEYLNEKPESRSVSYMAEEKHKVKCCYRCGNVYKESDECPKCGAKFND